MESQNSQRIVTQQPTAPIVSTQSAPPAPQRPTASVMDMTEGVVSANYHMEMQEEESNERAIQSFKLDPLDPFRYYHKNTTVHTLKSIIPIRRPRLKTIYKSSEMMVHYVASNSKETYLPILSQPEVTRYRREGYIGLHLRAIQIGLQPLFLAGKNVTCFVAIFDTRWQSFEKALISAVEVGLNQGPVVLQVEPNFTLDLSRPSITEVIKVLVQLNGLTMKPEESALAFHHSMTYKVQSHMFSMSSTGQPITRFMAGEGRVIQPKTYRQNQLSFPPQWINEYERSCKPVQIHENPKVQQISEGRVSVSFPTETKPLYPCEHCQLLGKPPSACTHMPRRSLSLRRLGHIMMIKTPEPEFVDRNNGTVAAAKWIV